jgi:hypothetical protein
MKKNRSIFGFFLRIGTFLCLPDLSEEFQRDIFEQQFEEGKINFGIFRD